VPEFIDPVFTKTSPKRSFSLNRKRAFWLVFVKTGSIISGTGTMYRISPCPAPSHPKSEQENYLFLGHRNLEKQLEQCTGLVPVRHHLIRKVNSKINY
jgi:hypothetical protein